MAVSLIKTKSLLPFPGRQGVNQDTNAFLKTSRKSAIFSAGGEWLFIHPSPSGTNRPEYPGV